MTYLGNKERKKKHSADLQKKIQEKYQYNKAVKEIK